MDKAFIQKIYHSHQQCTKCPPTTVIHAFFNDLLGVLFPDFANQPLDAIEVFENRIEGLKVELKRILFNNLVSAETEADEVVKGFFDEAPQLYDKLQNDITATFEGDPAAKTREEVIRSYPGFYAIAAYRVAHLLLGLGVRNIPRIITEHAHSKSGIDIHPHASIGEYFCIDHGTGVVIGETTVIGDHVKIYQGVTLGALSVNKEDAKIKRHPTIEDHVVLYAGATILGGNTIVGKNSIIGGNVWLTKSVPPDSKVYYQAQMHSGDSEKPDLIIYK
ncbi:MAG TPA: serine acetyltransferase [Cytophagales bacterium]|jgi:serine O-acetyltransferase|nr:serine acetyltransferase [Cytophagales bacterium]